MVIGRIASSRMALCSRAPGADRVDVEDADRRQREDRVHAGAGVLHQQLVRPDHDHHAVLRDRIAERVEHLRDQVRHEGLERHGAGIDQPSGRRRRKDKEADREGEHPEGAPARQQDDAAADHRNFGQHLDHQHVLRTPDDHHQEARKQDRPAGDRRGRDRDVLEPVTVLPGEPQRREDDHRAVAFLFGAPGPGDQLHVGRHIGGDQRSREQQGRPRRHAVGEKIARKRCARRFHVIDSWLFTLGGTLLLDGRRPNRGIAAARVNLAGAETGFPRTQKKYARPEGARHDDDFRVFGRNQAATAVAFFARR